MPENIREGQRAFIPLVVTTSYSKPEWCLGRTLSGKLVSVPVADLVFSTTHIHDPIGTVRRIYGSLYVRQSEEEWGDDVWRLALAMSDDADVCYSNEELTEITGRGDENYYAGTMTTFLNREDRQ